MLAMGYYGRLSGLGFKEKFSSIYAVGGNNRTYVFIDGKLNRIPPLDEYDTDLEEITEKEALEFLGLTKVEYNEEQCKEYDDKLKAELKAYRKALKQKKCYERHLKNLEKKKRR